VVVVAVGALAGFRYLKWCQGASGEQQPVSFVIPDGATGNEVIASLHAQEVIRCDAVGRYVAKAQGADTSFQAGSYGITTNMTMQDALDQLGEGPIVKTVTLTIPEGWRLTQITEEAAKRLHLSEDELRRLAESPDLTVPPYLPAGKGGEGFLFPQTYEFPKQGVTPKGVITALTDQFATEAKKLPWDNAKKLGVSEYEVVIIASLVEREARVSSERAKIAAVIYNRLDRNEIMGIDASNQYIDPDPSDGLTSQDLAIDSPYNGRLAKYAGQLPPTPIASPGLASLRAALEPANTEDWLYVLCSEDGHHEFTASYAAFQALKDQCL